MSTKASMLKGLRVLVTAIDLEQSEHRGIAVYSKGVLKALNQAGAEVWLLTQFDPTMKDVSASGIPSKTASIIFSARVLESLNSGENVNYQLRSYHGLLQGIPFYKQINEMRGNIKKLHKFLFPVRQLDQQDLKKINLKEIYDSPYFQSERLNYLQYAEGIICADDIFVRSFRLAQRRAGHVLRLGLEGFDGVITTCPLNIEVCNVRFLAQTIHDLIPLEYVQTSDNAIGFTRRLRACANSGRLFVSESTRHKYETTILQPASAQPHASCVVTQSPSLAFPADSSDWEARIPELSLGSLGRKHPQRLKPCGYLLFNSSVEPRKNLLFVLKAFIESGIESQGIKLCITGKLKADRYSATVKSLVSSHPDVLLMGYVDEATKRQLFLNALAVVSPSLVEGFGIPVLDAACLGLPVIASPSESHREIQQLHDFNEHVLLCSTLETSDWASAMRLIVGRMERQRVKATEGLPGHLRPQQQGLWLNELRQQRIRRYRQLQRELDEAFQASISRMIHSEMALGSQGEATASISSRS